MGPWQRLLDAIGPYYRDRLFKARDRAKAELADIGEERLESLAAEGRRTASSLDEEAARLTVHLHAERERHTQLADGLEREAARIGREARRRLSLRRRRQAREAAAERAGRAEEGRRLAAEAHEQLRELGQRDRHLYPWFERHEDALGRRLAAELALDSARSAVYHVLGAPSIASLTAACLNSDRAIDLERLEQLVSESGDRRQRLLFEVAGQLHGSDQNVLVSDLLLELDGEDLDRVLEAIAVLKRRQLTIPTSRADLWIRASEPDGWDADNPQLARRCGGSADFRAGVSSVRG